MEHGLPSSGYILLKDMNCPIEINLGELQSGAYVSNNFEYYSLNCDNIHCTAEISRLPSYAYTLVLDDSEGDACFTQDTDLGRYICNSLRNQGWDYFDMEF